MIWLTLGSVSCRVTWLRSRLATRAAVRTVPEESGREERGGGEDERDDALRERRRVEDGEEEHGDELADVVDHRDHAVEDKEARRVRVETAAPENRPQQQQQ